MDWIGLGLEISVSTDSMIDDCLFVAARFDEIKQRFSEMHFVAQATSTVQV